MLNLKLSLIGAATVLGLLISVACGSEAPGKTPPATTETPAPSAPTSSETAATQAESAATAEFNKRVAAYVEVHKKADGQVPSLKRTDDPKEISSREIALGDAIRTLRAGARPGDIMTPDIAAEFRRLIKMDYRGRSRGSRSSSSTKSRLSYRQ